MMKIIRHFKVVNDFIQFEIIISWCKTMMQSTTYIVMRRQCGNIRYLYNKNLNTTAITVDQKNVDKFANISKEASWWETSNALTVLRNYHKANMPNVTRIIAEHYNLKYENLSNYLQGLTILDIGCGGGLLSEPLAKLGANVIGIDVCEVAIKRAIEHSKKDTDITTNLHYQVSTIEDYSVLNKDLYDVVLSSHVLDFVKEPDYFLNLCCMKSKPGGLVIIEAKNRTITSFLTMILWGSVISRQIPRGLLTWSKFNKPNEIIKILEESGVHNLKTIGYGLTPFFNAENLKLCRNLSTLYMVTGSRKIEK